MDKRPSWTVLISQTGARKTPWTGHPQRYHEFRRRLRDLVEIAWGMDVRDDRKALTGFHAIVGASVLAPRVSESSEGRSFFVVGRVLKSSEFGP